MIPINNSDTAWLILSDYNQDNNIPYKDLREDVLNPEIDQFHWQFDEFVREIGNFVGSEEDFVNTGNGVVGDRSDRGVGGVINSSQVGDIIGYRKIGKRVGSNAPD